MTYNRAILGTGSLQKWSHCDGHLVESHVTVRVMILMIPRKVIRYDPISLGPCRKEVLGGIKPPHFCLLAFSSFHTSLNFLMGPSGPPLGPRALAPATPPLSVGLLEACARD